MAGAHPMIVAHRGASFDAPENTLAAFRLAFEQGADAIEGDFHLTADGEVVCTHDARTRRCGDLDRVVAESTLAELKTVDVGVWKSSRFAGERIPTLTEVLSVVPPGKGIFVELKSGGALVAAVAEAIAASRLPLPQIRLISFDVETLRSCGDRMPEVKRSWLVNYCGSQTLGWSPDAEAIETTIGGLGVEGLGSEANVEAVTPAIVNRIRVAGVELHVWTIDDVAIADAFMAMGARSITTNRPALFANHFR